MEFSYNYNPHIKQQVSFIIVDFLLFLIFNKMSIERGYHPLLSGMCHCIHIVQYHIALTRPSGLDNYASIR